MDFPYIDPVIFSIGPVSLHWYGMMYLLGFIAAWLLGNYRADQPNSGWTREQVSDVLFYAFLGVIIGGRIGYVVFYHMDLWREDFLYLFKIWEGGMSFHGGLLGLVGAAFYFSRKEKKKMFEVADFMTPLGPLGLLFGRIGNFINGELWGRETDESVPWAIRFACDAEKAPWYRGCDTSGVLRHPSQLYEALFEGLLLFIVVWVFSSKPRPAKSVTGLFLIGYGASRFVIEYFREPDSHLAAVSQVITRGQLLCIPMIIAGAILIYLAYKKTPVKK